MWLLLQVKYQSALITIPVKNVKVEKKMSSIIEGLI